jgi:ABC-type transport system involved in cytochrome bd biosynthesis fused ATPase/permease subunit
MKNYRIIFYLVFAVYQLLIFFFILYAEPKVVNVDWGFLIRLRDNFLWFKYGAFIGFVFVLIDFVWSYLFVRSEATEKQKLQQEVNSLKAKLFDTQESAKQKLAEDEVKSEQS